MEYIKEYSIFDNLSELPQFQIQEFNEIVESLMFIEHIRNDEQLDTSHENYSGFVNVRVDFFRDPKMQKYFKSFVKHVNIMKPILDLAKLDVEEYADEDETIIHNRYSDYYIREL